MTVHGDHAVLVNFSFTHFHQTDDGPPELAVGFHQRFGSKGGPILGDRSVGIHEQVVSQHHEKGPVNGVKRTPDGIADAFGFTLMVDQDLHALSGMKQFSVYLWTVAVMVRAVLEQRLERFVLGGDDVKPTNAGGFGLENEMGQQRHIDQRQGFFGQGCAHGKHARAQSCSHQYRVVNGVHDGLKRRRLSSVVMHPTTMEEKVDHRWLAAAGVVLVLQTFVDVTPEGPWSSRSFSRGVLGLTGLFLLYAAWFRQTFGQYGLAPTVNRWQHPSETWLNVVVFGLGCLVVTRLIRLSDLNAITPEPAGLVLSFIGWLAVFNGAYVWLITKGPLTEEEE